MRIKGILLKLVGPKLKLAALQIYCTVKREVKNLRPSLPGLGRSLPAFNIINQSGECEMASSASRQNTMATLVNGI
jgi:hypothetical protein